MVVESRASQSGVIEFETKRFDQMQVAAGVCTEANDVSRVAGDLRFVQYDMEVGHRHMMAHLGCDSSREILNRTSVSTRWYRSVCSRRVGVVIVNEGNVVAEKSHSRVERDSRTRILAGAGRAFGKLGYGTCRVEDIIEEAGVSRGTFYKFFDSKEAVFDEIEQAFELSFVHSMEGVFDPDAQPWHQAEALIDGYLRWIAGWRDVARMLWTDPTRPRAETLNETRANAFNAFIAMIGQMVAGTHAAGANPLVYRGILGAISEIGLYVIELPRVTDAELKKARDAIIQVVVGSLSPSEVDHS